MKKLLLGALLVVGATAFAQPSADLSQGSGQAVIPVTLRGSVINTTNLTLLLSAENESGLSTEGVELTFNSIVQGKKSAPKRSKIIAELYKNNDVAAFEKEADSTSVVPEFKLLRNSKPTGSDSSMTYTGDLQSANGTVTYRLTTPNPNGLAYESILTAEVTPNAVGSFYDNASGVQVTVTGLK